VVGMNESIDGSQVEVQFVASLESARPAISRKCVFSLSKMAVLFGSNDWHFKSISFWL
jgi:hypothetical protein